MAKRTWDAPSTTGVLDLNTNWDTDTAPGAADDLNFNPTSTRDVSANLGAFAALDMGAIKVDGFTGSIGASDEFFKVKSATTIKYDGLGAGAYFEGDFPVVTVYGTGAGELHLQTDGSAATPQDIPILYARTGKVFIDNGAASATKIVDIHVWPGVEVTIAAGVVHSGDIIFHGGGVVNDWAGGAGRLRGSGGTYNLKGSAARTNGTAHELWGTTYDHQSSGAGGPVDVMGNASNLGKLVTINNRLGGTFGAVTVYDGGIDDLADTSSGVIASSITRIPEAMAV